MQKSKNKSKTKSTNKVNKSEGIFDYDLEVSNTSSNIRKEKKLTQKAKRIPKEEEENTNRSSVQKASKEKIKKIQKRKKKEQKEKQKELAKQEKEYTKVETQKIKRPTKEQMRKRKLRIKRIQSLSILMLIIAGIILLLLSPIFNIKNIEIYGNEKVPQTTILSLLGINEETNIFRETNKLINEKLKQEPYIDSVIVKRELPSKLKLQIKERTIDYIIKVGEVYGYINNQGYILEISGERAEGKIELQGYDTSVEHIVPLNQMCAEDLEKMKDIEKIISVFNTSNLGNLITSINIHDEDEYIINIDSEQKTIHIGDVSNLDIKMLYIKTIMEKEKGNAGKIYVNRNLNIQKPYFSPNI